MPVEGTHQCLCGDTNVYAGWYLVVVSLPDCSGVMGLRRTACGVTGDFSLRDVLSAQGCFRCMTPRLFPEAFTGLRRNGGWVTKWGVGDQVFLTMSFLTKFSPWGTNFQVKL